MVAPEEVKQIHQERLIDVLEMMGQGKLAAASFVRGLKRPGVLPSADVAEPASCRAGMLSRRALTRRRCDGSARNPLESQLQTRVDVDPRSCSLSVLDVEAVEHVKQAEAVGAARRPTRTASFSKDRTWPGPGGNKLPASQRRDTGLAQSVGGQPDIREAGEAVENSALNFGRRPGFGLKTRTRTGWCSTRAPDPSVCKTTRARRCR